MSPSRLPVLTADQAATWDDAAARAGISAQTLMETAGRAVALLLIERFPAAAGRGVLVACGPGNNGGDGWVVARVLHRHGAPVWVAALPPSSELATGAAERARADGVREVAPDGPWPAVGCLVDAILGTGAAGGAPRGPAGALADRAAELAVPVLAVDGPTGLDLSDGVSRGRLRADLSVTFGGYRRGHLLARDEVGDVVVVDLGFPPPDPAWPEFYPLARAAAALPPLAARAHKSTRGRVVVVGGDQGLTGAARLSARAAFAAGAGLVHILAPAASAALLSAAEPDLQTRVQPFDADLSDESAALLEGADAVLVGPGLNRHPTRAAFVLDVLRRTKTTVLDADALTALQGRVPALAELAASRPVVLTPHAGEFRTLFPALASGTATDPWSAVVEAARLSHATVLLKGVPTVIGSPSGSDPSITVAAGNPGLATGGSGDTLSGLIVTFLAQGLAPAEAAALGAHALGSAADLAARRASARSLRPMEVVAALPDVWRSWGFLLANPSAPRPPVLHELERPIHT